MNREKLCDQNSQQDYILTIDVNNRIYHLLTYEDFDDTKFIMRSNSQIELYSPIKTVASVFSLGKLHLLASLIFYSWEKPSFHTRLAP